MSPAGNKSAPERHPQRASLLGLLAGVTSAALYVSGAMGGAAGAGLAAVAPLPLFMAALGWGLSAGTIAAITASVFVTLPTAMIGAPIVGAAFAVSCAAPALWLSRLALLRRPLEPANPDSAVEWYPLGRLLLWIAGLAILGFLAGELIALATTGKGLPGLVETRLDQWITADMRQRLEVEPGDWPQLRQAVADLMPSAMGMGWQLTMLGNLAAAASILTKAGKALRPPLGWGSLSLPRLLAPGVVLCFLLALALPGASYWAGTIAAQLVMAYFFLGLTVVHAIPIAGPGRVLLLGLFYFLILFQGAAIIVALLGLGEQWFGLRARLSARRTKG